MRAALVGREEVSEKDRMPSALGDARMCALAGRAIRGRTAVEAAVAERAAVAHARTPTVAVHSGSIM
jgi:hypothetical protein